MTKMRCELLNIQGAQNVRDVGGYPLTNGKTLQKRKFIRAGSLANLTPQGVASLRGLGVDCVVDLRSRRECELMPSRLPEDFAIARYHLPMLDHIQSDVSEGRFQFPSSMSAMYCGLLDGDQHTFREIFSIFADPRHNAVLYHCTAGKDRTGVTTMLLLGLCGLDDDSIIEDYSWSDQLIQQELDPPIGIPDHVLRSAPEYMRDTLAHLHKVYGSQRGYLEKIGITAAQMQIIVEKMINK
jgi:protein-tyrosine phosphatase